MNQNVMVCLGMQYACSLKEIRDARDPYLVSNQELAPACCDFAFILRSIL